MEVKNTGIECKAVPVVIKQYEKSFQNRNSFKISSANSFQKRLPNLLALVNKKWHPTTAKAKYFSQFSRESWLKLSPKLKNMHSMQSCVACLQMFPVVHSKFPGNPKKLINIPNNMKKKLKHLQGAQGTQPKVPFPVAKKAATTIFEEVSGVFEQHTGHSLSKCLANSRL